MPTFRHRLFFLRNPWLWAFLIGIMSLTLIRPLLRREPLPPPVMWALPEFHLVTAENEPFGLRDLEGRVWIAGFFFTRCPSICPMLTAAMAQLQHRYDENAISGIRLLSISVDPEHDTVERLREFGAANAIDPERWTLLTGEGDRVHDLVVEGFKTPLGRPEIGTGGVMDIVHDGKLALLDGQGRVRGFYGIDVDGLDEVFHRAQHVLRQQNARMPALPDSSASAASNGHER